MDMNASKCEHRKMKREEVAEFTNEVMDDVESKSK